MKTATKPKMKNIFYALAFAAAVAVSLRASAQSNVFTRVTYQGFLKDYGISPNDSNGHYDFRYGVVIGPLDPDNPWRTNCPTCLTAFQATNSIVVNQGLFTTTLMMPTGMLHSVSMNGTNVFLEFAIRTNGGGAFTTLTPLQPLSATPYAIVAESISGPVQATSLTGLLPSGQLGGNYGNPLSFVNQQNVFGGDGSLLANVNALTLGGFAPCDLPCYWKTNGNAGTDPDVSFIGTIDNVALTMRVNDKPALKIFPDIVVRPNDINGINPPVEPMESPNIRGGFVGNFLHPNNKGVTIAGGGSRYDHVFHSPVDLSGRNMIDQASDYSFLGCGSANYVKGPHNSVVGGHYNYIVDANYGFIGGGGENLITHPVDSGAIVAGLHNTITGSDNTNYPSGDSAFIGAGNDNLATNSAAFIGAGATNVAGGAYSVVVGGQNNQVLGDEAVIGGGSYNVASGLQSSVGGGWHNIASGWASVVAGGFTNVAAGQISAVGGGYRNQANGLSSTVSGGQDNRTSGDASTIGGGVQNTNLAFYGTIGGGALNSSIGTLSTTIAGGYQNVIVGQDTTIGGGSYNTAKANYSIIAGGQYNTVTTNADASVVGGGRNNRIESVDYGPGIGIAYATGSVIGGGEQNLVSGAPGAVIIGGANNTNSGLASAILAGEKNVMMFDHSLASGNGALSRKAFSVTQGSMFSTPGDGQIAQYLLNGTTISTNTFDLVGPIPPVGSSIGFTAIISAKAFGNFSGAFEVKGVIRNYGGAIAFVAAPTVTVLARDNASLIVTPIVGNGGRLGFRVTGIIGLNVRWVGSLQTAEVQF
jgi:hypothetical protein